MKSNKQELNELFDQNLIRIICPEFSGQKFISMLNNHPWLNYSLGCMFGCFIGDSLGAYVEFAKKIDDKIVEQLMKMIPGGTFNLRAGQVTDDSQMSFHLLEALFRIDTNKSFEQQKTDLLYSIAEQYSNWKQSIPFDMGITCRNGIQAIEQTIKLYKPKKTIQKQQCLKKITKKIIETSSKSQSNGSLMKITPLVFFGIAISENLYRNQSNKYLYKEFVKNQIQLLHPNQTIIASSSHWFKVLWRICTRNSQDTLKNIYDIAMEAAQGNQRLKQWVIQAQTKNPMDPQINQGWAKIAWSIGMRLLESLKDALIKRPNFQLDSQFYKSYISRVISKGGDTDTNAAIIGGLLGAIIGFKNLPKEYLFKIFSLNFANKELRRGHDRPDFYQPRRVFVKVYLFLQKLNVNLQIQKFKQ